MSQGNWVTSANIYFVSNIVHLTFGIDGVCATGLASVWWLAPCCLGKTSSGCIAYRLAHKGTSKGEVRHRLVYPCLALFSWPSLHPYREGQLPKQGEAEPCCLRRRRDPQFPLSQCVPSAWNDRMLWKYRKFPLRKHFTYFGTAVDQHFLVCLLSRLPSLASYTNLNVLQSFVKHCGKTRLGAGISICWLPMAWTSRP